jgi:DNA-binding PadR family transcriptional regulator
LVVLSMVYEEPMHAYKMHSLIKERGKDLIANVAQRNSVYQTLRGLLRAGLIAVRETERDERRPERTIYEITPEGRKTLRLWMETVLSSPAQEYPDFPAALSHVAGAKPDELRALLEKRLPALEAKLAGLEVQIPELPRVFTLETEYAAALVSAEIKWLRGVVADLKSGQLTWNEEMLRRIAAQLSSANALPPAAGTGRPQR